ncbi:hypothetical protein C8A01DRAFT_15832 [Parachaetomium inaequale]|uniref:Uncharacterized protein n=1 Tax=Parachaetomium inaequale TaxID=2588326 RepID=A0AAN6PFY3_9PEZI|nr:hypothetical protein C8A01DRAFT_15832 [Parachaetomium inaequale]
MASIASRSAASPSVSASPASTLPTSVESKQDDDLLTIQFTNVQDLFDVINCATGDFLTVTHVSPSNFTEIERERERQRRRFRFRRYNSNRQTLLITIPTDLHEALHIGIYQGYRDQLVTSGKANSWRTIGTAIRRARQGHPGGNGGEGDSTGGPKLERGVKDAWPTLVVEAGVSESLSELHNDMRWWFSTSDHQVQIVLLAKFEHTRRAITLEKWEEEPYDTRPGATTTRHAAALQPVLRQTITITQDTTTDPVSYNVTRGALVLGFRLLFLRDPGPGEGDFILSIQELEDYAKNVWDVL